MFSGECAEPIQTSSALGVNSLLKKLPRILARVSPVYYKPMSVREFKRLKLNQSEPGERFPHQVSVYSMNYSESDSFCSVEPSHGHQLRYCLVCCTKQANTVLMECGHGGICYECSLDMMKNRNACHICRAEIAHILALKYQTLSMAYVKSQKIVNKNE